MKLCLLIFTVIIYTAPYTAIAAQQLNLDGNISLWWDIYEENENGIIQAGSLDKAAEVASGFNLRQARLAFNHEDTGHLISSRFQIRFEERIAILDCYSAWRPSRLFNLYAGQIKVPSTYEVLISDEKLDFISRSTLSKNLTDWSLSRPPYYSPFYGNRSDYRDPGIGIKGSIGMWCVPDLASYFFMVSNGLGANLSIGGRENKEFIFSNSFGDYFYGVRMDLSPFKWLRLGGHYSWNKHDNIIYNDEKTALDLKRNSCSMDIHLIIPRIWITAMYGAGEVDDDYFQVNQSNLKYTGWESKVMAGIMQDKLWLGLRYDSYTEKFFGSDALIKQNNITFGINFAPISAVRLQLNYTIKETDSAIETDLKDNILFLNFQYSFRYLR